MGRKSALGERGVETCYCGLGQQDLPACGFTATALLRGQGGMRGNLLMAWLPAALRSPEPRMQGLKWRGW